MASRIPQTTPARRLARPHLAAIALATIAAPTTAQTRPTLDRVLAFPTPIPGEELQADRGAAGAWHRIRKLTTTASILHVTAHPDDEHSGMLTLASRGWGARTALLSLNRGEAGANAIGPELFDALGTNPHPRAGPCGPILRPGRPLLHDRRRLRLLQVGRRGVPELGARGRARRHGPRDPPQPAARGGGALSWHGQGRSRASSRGGAAYPRGGRRCRRSRPLPGSDLRGGIAPVAGPAGLSRGRAGRGALSFHRGRERVQRLAGHELSAIRQPRAQSAAVADFGAHAARRRAGLPI